MDKIRDIFKKININGSIEYDADMRNHTSFRVGGLADIFITPETIRDAEQVFLEAAKLDIPVFPLGEGANILVSDLGIRGIVLSLKNIKDVTAGRQTITAGAGASISDVAKIAASQGLAGLEFIYGMPGSVGGSVYMNARCYGREISQVLHQVTTLSRSGKIKTVAPSRREFSYKKSPFQNSGEIILEAVFSLSSGNKTGILKKMDEYLKDREQKGHFKYPSAGSIFKNSRAFGKPAGQLIDSLGLKGHRIGDGQIAEFHGNIIVNRGNARASDIKSLIEFVEREVLSKLHFQLEREVVLVGDWGTEGII